MNNPEIFTIKEVERKGDIVTISGDGATIFPIDRMHDIPFKEGDVAAVHCKGTLVRGLDINGERVFYKSDGQLQKEHEDYKAKRKKEREEEFQKNKESLDRSYDELPEVFRKRIDKFRANNPEFRVDYEPYEMFCCEEALKIANTLKDPEKVQEFHQLSVEEQKEWVEMDDGHSGNTFGMSVQLAYLYLTDPQKVVEMHGALAPLVGSEEYGCVPSDN